MFGEFKALGSAINPADIPSADPTEWQKGSKSLSNAFERYPARMYIQNLDIPEQEALHVQFNPAELDETIGTNLAKITSPGLSHEHVHFINTKNLKYSFTLYFHALMGNRMQGASMEARLESLQQARRFLHSLCYPRANASDVATGGAPRVLFVWPKMVSIQAVIDGDINFKYTEFTADGLPYAFTATVPLSEIRDLKLTSQDVFSNGTLKR